MTQPSSSLLVSSLLVALTGCATSAPAVPVPQRILLSAMEEGEAIGQNGWKMNAFSITRADVPAKFGEAALTFRGTAEGAGSKGDFGLPGNAPGNVKSLALWVHVADNANVSSIGLQVRDAEGEFLIMQVPVDWTGWKKVEFDLATAPTTQTWPQNDKNKKIDLPINGVSFLWYAKAAGPTAVTVDALVATTEMEASPLQVGGAWSGATTGEPGQPMKGLLVLTNFTDDAAAPKVTYSIQRDPSWFAPAPMDPVYGSDLAVGAKNWTEEKGKRIDEGSLTDGRDWTAANAPWGDHTETLQTVDLGKSRRITRLVAGPSDGNWLQKVDVSGSADGVTYTPVPGLQGFNLHGSWSAQVLPVKTPFEARFLRLHHHADGVVVRSIAMPSSLSVYDGVEDENWALPTVGEVVDTGTLAPTVPKRSFDSVPVVTAKPLAPGSYLVALKVTAGTSNQLVYAHYMVKPPQMAGFPDLAATASSRFGLNTALVQYAPEHRHLGVGWVRFENFKWRMANAAPKDYRFDGTVGPWFVNHDQIVDGYAKEGINFLPYLFETPEYASSIPATAKQERYAAYAPKDNATYGEFTFQSAARFGSKPHPAAELLTPDKKSGLNKVHYWELWNEPNLNDPGWGPFVGTIPAYLELFRAGAEGVKRADPAALVTNGGWGGMDVETVDPLRSYKYADGKRPLDFVDILNVHYYSGRVAPEVASVDGNADRSGGAQGGRTFEEDLHRLVAWRDANKKSMPIWMTETGYDSAGSFGTDERTQAARLPRVVMMMLAAGIDKVFVYRETGSTASMHAASGVMRNDGSYKPSWFTYATLIRQLDKVTAPAQRLPYPDPNVRLYLWKRGTESFLTAWTIEGSANLDLKLGKASVTDAFGSESAQTLTGKFPLTIYPTYLNKITDLAPVQKLVVAAEKAEADKVVENKRLAGLKTYLFDFGSEDKVGTLELGTVRPFTPVLSKNLYTDAQGYGFVTPAMSDETAGWISDPLERDAVRIGKGTEFKIKAEPGKYTLRLSASPFGKEPVNALIKGALGGEKTVAVTQEETHGQVAIEVGAEPVTVSLDNYAMLRWISLVKQ